MKELKKRGLRSAVVGRVRPAEATGSYLRRHRLYVAPGETFEVELSFNERVHQTDAGFRFPMTRPNLRRLRDQITRALA